MIHIYCGDGKGKTTAATGLAVRACGAGKRVVFAHFFKDGSSSEIAVLHSLPNVSTLHACTVRGFWRRMSEAERAQARADYTRLFHDACAQAEDADLLIFDEIISACNHGAVPLEDVVDFLRQAGEACEIVLTGRDPAPELLALADYVTEMCKRAHPYDRGIPARKGIEF